MSSSENKDAIPPPASASDMKNAFGYPVSSLYPSRESLPDPEDLEVNIPRHGPPSVSSIHDLPYFIRSRKPLFPSKHKPFFRKRNPKREDSDTDEELDEKTKAKDISKRHIDDAVQDIIAEWKKSVK